MKARQFKKLCQRAREALIALGDKADDFDMDCEELKTRRGKVWPVVWVHWQGPDYWGESDSCDAWYRLQHLICIETTDWENYDPDGGGEWPTARRFTTIQLFRYCRQLIASGKKLGY